MSPKPQTPLTKRENYPNLLLGPRSPNKGRGRLQVQIRRAFAVREVLTSTEIYDSCYAKRRVAVEADLESSPVSSGAFAVWGSF